MAPGPTPPPPTLRSAAPPLSTVRGLRLAAALLVLVQLVGLAHLAFAPHGLCWEHGVVVELEGALTAAAEPTTAPGLGRNAAVGVRSDAHQHCPALWLHRQLGPSRPAQPVLVASTPIERPVLRQAVVAARWEALVRAPKQSPPV
jgi:hypothetical protein